jgi:hypothetical protein
LSLILDASMTLAWQFKRVDPAEILLAEKALMQLAIKPAVIPALWFVEVANGDFTRRAPGRDSSHADSLFSQ